MMTQMPARRRFSAALMAGMSQKRACRRRDRHFRGRRSDGRKMGMEHRRLAKTGAALCGLAGPYGIPLWMPSVALSILRFMTTNLTRP